MRKKLWIGLLAGTMALTAVIGFVSCRQTPDSTGGNNQEQGGNQGPKLPETPVVGTEGLAYTLSYDDTFYIASGMGTCTATEIVIGNIYNNLPVTQIKTSAFARCSELTEVIIPGGITDIANYAFRYCSSLASITLGDDLQSIGVQSFLYCEALTEITIPSSLTKIDIEAFEYCSSLTSITLGSGLKTIEGGAFAVCPSLTSITIPQSVTKIGNDSFNFCSGLESIAVESGNEVYHSEGNCLIETATKTLVLGCKTSVIPTDGSVAAIGVCAFDGCKFLTQITIPDSVTSIGKQAFYDCEGLTSVTMGNGMTTIGDHAFYYCSALTKFTIPDSVVSIGKAAFYGDYRLIETENGVEYVDKWVVRYDCVTPVIVLRSDTVGIADRSFYQMEGDTVLGGALTEITIPDTLKHIGENVFSSEQRSLKIQFNGTKAEWLAIDKGSDWEQISREFTILCTDGTLDKDGNEIE